MPILNNKLTSSLDDDSDKLTQVANAPTPPYVDPIKDTFSLSLNFGDDENPWIA
jgi:hypothetical protein